MAKNDLAAAIDDYGRAIELQPANFENYFNRGITLYNKRDLDAALADFTKAIELEPSSQRCRFPLFPFDLLLKESNSA